MTRRILLLPSEISSFDNLLTFTTLSHPATNQSVIFGVSKDHGLFQISLWENKMNSWAIGNSILSDGNLYIATPFDVLYLLIPILEKTKNKGFLKLEDILYESEANGAGMAKILEHLEQLTTGRLAIICDQQDVDGDLFVRLSDEKLASWLKRKTMKIVENMDKLEACKEHLTPIMSENEKIKLGIRILSDVLTASAKGMLMKSLNLNDLKGEALVYFKDEIKHRSKDPDVIAEKKNVKKAKPTKALKSHNTKGMKKLTEYFSKKAK